MNWLNGVYFIWKVFKINVKIKKLSKCSGVTVLLLIFIHFYQKTSVQLSDGDTTTAEFLNCILASFLISFKLSYLKIIRWSTCSRVVDGGRDVRKVVSKWRFWRWVLKNHPVFVNLIVDIHFTPTSGLPFAAEFSPRQDSWLIVTHH